MNDTFSENRRTGIRKLLPGLDVPGERLRLLTLLLTGIAAFALARLFQN